MFVIKVKVLTILKKKHQFEVVTGVRTMFHWHKKLKLLDHDLLRRQISRSQSAISINISIISAHLATTKMDASQ
jgi:hypothetical protein